MIWLLVLLLLLLAIGGGVVVSKALFLILVVALALALFGVFSGSATKATSTRDPEAAPRLQAGGGGPPACGLPLLGSPAALSSGSLLRRARVRSLHRRSCRGGCLRERSGSPAATRPVQEQRRRGDMRSSTPRPSSR